MESGTAKQIFELLKKSQKILIFLPEVFSADELASGLALRLFLKKMQKDAEVLSAGRLADSLKFLPGSAEVKSALAVSKSLVLTLDTSVKKLEEISYQSAGDKVHVYLKPAGADFTPEDISFSREKFPVDAAVILGARSLEGLGPLYEQFADLFFETPKINV
ncbi:MAG TPA: hypothetical protein VHA30_04595, partial [Patescibacteria group bacterium]|nr:hypothetical protein [Patescibacteria group bacterium]